MKIIITVVVALIIIGTLVYFGIQKVGDLRPAILPPSSNTITNQTDNRETSGNQKIGQAAALTVPEGFKIGIFARNLGQARDLQFSPEGTLLLTDMAGGKVYALPDRNNDGVADENKTVLQGLNRPHGMAFFQGDLYLAEEKRVSRYKWDENNLTANLDEKVLDLPAGGRHFTRSLVFKDDGTLFISLGSTCDVCKEEHEWIGTIIQTNGSGQVPGVFAWGLRNAVFLTLDQNENLWVTEMGRDFLGDNLPPDEVNLIELAGNYGWPNCYGQKVPDKNFNPSADCTHTKPAAFDLPAHNAPLGLTFVDSDRFPQDWQGDLLVALHGSWNRSVPDGYKVVKLNREGDKLTGSEDFITGFIKGNQAAARPVDLIFDSAGSLYLSDDKSGSVYKIIHE